MEEVSFDRMVTLNCEFLAETTVQFFLAHRRLPYCWECVHNRRIPKEELEEITRLYPAGSVGWASTAGWWCYKRGMPPYEGSSACTEFIPKRALDSEKKIFYKSRAHIILLQGK